MILIYWKKVKGEILLVFRDYKKDLIQSSCLALGMFDGVHIGHKEVLLSAVNKAKQYGALSTVVTFSKHPQIITNRTPTKLITNIEERLKLFETLGLEAVLVLDFDEKLSHVKPDKYIEDILVKSLNPKSISTGYDHRFGEQKKGDNVLLQSYATTYGYEVSIIPPVQINGQVASSSAIRKFISIGDLESAATLLNRQFSVNGEVIHGEKRGTAMGFPTANIAIPDFLIAPASAVYAGGVRIKNEYYQAVINVGTRPTFGSSNQSLIEVHILDFNDLIYGEIVNVSFMKKIRDEKQFSSIDQLIHQIELDCQFASEDMAII